MTLELEQAMMSLPEKVEFQVFSVFTYCYKCYPFNLWYSKCWFSTDRIKQRSRIYCSELMTLLATLLERARVHLSAFLAQNK